jgi:hypothetical protein
MSNQILQKKLDLYEKFFKEMKEIELLEAQYDNPDNFDIIENDKIRTNLSNSILVINKGDKILELPQKDQNAIHEQDNLHNFLKAKTYLEKTSKVYSTLKYIINAGKWLLFL